MEGDRMWGCLRPVRLSRVRLQNIRVRPLEFDSSLNLPHRRQLLQRPALDVPSWARTVTSRISTPTFNSIGWVEFYRANVLQVSRRAGLELVC